MSKEANNYTTKSNSTPLPTGKGVRLIISGGGAGGHIFPAISIANAIKELCPDAEILFVGAEGRMEMQRVPDAGYRIIGLPVAGFDRKHLWKNFSVLLKLIRSQWKARSIIKEFRPQVAVGVGGYASGPTLKMAGMMGIPTLIQEQNSYAGVTNKLLAQKACKICVAYDYQGRRMDYPPQESGALERVTPIYESVPGWKEDITACKTWDELPEAARAYVLRLEELSGVPVSMVSVGPDRNQTIFR